MGMREDGFFRRKTDFFVFFKKGGFGGVAGEEIIRHKKIRSSLCARHTRALHLLLKEFYDLA